MATPIYKRGVYLIGPDITNISNDTLVEFKIGLSDNTPLAREQRLGERQRQCYSHQIEHAWFPTNQGDARVRHYLCRNFKDKIGTSNKEGGREIVLLFAKDAIFLVEQATRYFNAASGGLAKLHTFLMREEQEAALEKTITFFNDPINKGKEFLWNCKMRFGKTHTAYELLMSLDAKLVLILTGRPTDTKQAWIDAMDHVDFDFGIENFIDASKQGNKPIVVNNNKRTIIFASTHDFARIEDGDLKDKFSCFPELTFDLLIKDECHLNFDTEKTPIAISKLTCKYVLNLSGTPFKVLSEERFSEDAMFAWSYIDEQRVRKNEIILLGQERAEKEGQYYWLSPMCIFTILLSPELYDESEQFTEDEGFTFTKLFAIEENNSKHVFRNDTAVRAFVNSLCRGFIMPYSRQAHNSHQYESINLKHTMWYVPGVKQANVLSAMLKKHDIFKQYDIIIAAGDNGNEGNDTSNLVKSRIADIESGRNKKHIGTITLSCGKLSHGISIKEWGSVLNLSDMASAQLYFQLIFRGQTPWNGVKNQCYVFDFNPNRTLTHIHTLAKTTAGTSDIMPVLSETLKLFNVLCYEGTEFRNVDASDLISKLESGFGRSSSLSGIQNILAGFCVDWGDVDINSDLRDIFGGSSAKTREINVNENEAKNGKNSKRKKNEDGDDDEDDQSDDVNDDEIDDKNDEELSDDEKEKRKQIALRSVPLYWLTTRANSFDELVASLDIEQNRRACKAITSFQARSLKKLLVSQANKDKQHILNAAISRFRFMEKKDHEEFCNEILSDLPSKKLDLIQHFHELERKTNIAS